MSIMNCDRCWEFRDSDYIEFAEREEGNVCEYCIEVEDDDDC